MIFSCYFQFPLTLFNLNVTFMYLVASNCDIQQGRLRISKQQHVHWRRQQNSHDLHGAKCQLVRLYIMPNIMQLFKLQTVHVNDFSSSKKVSSVENAVLLCSCSCVVVCFTHNIDLYLMLRATSWAQTIVILWYGNIQIVSGCWCCCNICCWCGMIVQSFSLSHYVTVRYRLSECSYICVVDYSSVLDRNE